MTLRQQFLKLVYPIFNALSKKSSKAALVKRNEKEINPLILFYSLSSTLNNGEELDFENLKGKNVLIVNTASDCGFTAQYEELEKLYQLNKENLVVIAFPANDFKDQEKGTDDEIASFCKLNYGVSFRIMKKTEVVGSHQNEIFKWLSNEQNNGWCNQQPVWNFSKYLINKNGMLTCFYGPSISPLSEEIINEIKK